MTHQLAQSEGRYHPNDDSGKKRKWHIITEQKRARHTRKRPRCGQDNWYVTEDSARDYREDISDEELRQFINMGIVCGNCVQHYEFDAS